MITLTLRPHIESGGYHLDRFDGFLHDRHIVTSRQPLYDGARVLLELGYAPETPLTIRHVGKDYDSFLPRPLGELAKWTIAERDKDGLRRERWRPGPEARDHAVPRGEGVRAGDEAAAA